MTKEHFYQIKCLKDHYPHLVSFVIELAKTLPLGYIDTNDWECNLMPGVYVHNKKYHFKMRRYCRCAKSDVKRAITYYLKNL